MKVLDKILFAQDFSSTSKHLQSVATSFAKRFNSTVVPMHVLPKDVINPKTKKLLADSANEKLAQTIDDFQKNGIQTENPILKYGVVHHLIASTATAINANMILIGSGSHAEKDKFQLGTTTERIIQDSQKPVLVIKEDDKFDIHTILCPVDFSDTSKRALTNAIIIARRFDAHLTVLSVSEELSSSWFISKEELKKENEVRFEKHKKEFDKFLEQFKFDNVNWSKLQIHGIPSKEILNTITTKNIDLLVMGTVGRTGLNRLIVGSVTEKVIREMPCSFLTLKSQDIIARNLHSNIDDFEALFEAGEQLEKDGFYEAAIEKYEASLNINNMYVPAYVAIARLFDKLDKPEKAALYQKSANEIKERMWYSKIEEEVRKLKSS